ncbi:MAG TPA: S9 family peptidase [Vicinamibacteria bacterium]|nr:S9 family peptidase [Vicinamibacteria bacterium]
MRAIVTLAALLAGPATAAEVAWSPELAFEVKRVGPVLVSPDGRRAAFVVAEAVMEPERSEWVSQIWVADLDGGNPVPLTRGETSSSAPAWSPDGRWIAFVSARGAKGKGGKDPKPNVWRIRVDGGEAEPLTGEKGGAATPRFSPDGRHVAFLLTDAPSEEEDKAVREKRDAKVVGEDARHIRLALVPVEPDAEGKRAVRRLTPGPLSVGFAEGPGHFDWSPDGRWIAFHHQPRPLVDQWPASDVSMVEVATGTVRTLASTGASETRPFFSPDGRWVAYEASDEPPTWAFAARIHVVPALGGASRALAPTFDEQPDLLGWSADGTRVVVHETRGTVGRVAALPVDGSVGVDLTSGDIAVDSPALAPDRDRIGFVSQAPDRAPEAFVGTLPEAVPSRARGRAAGSGWSAVQVSNVQDVADVPLGRTEVVSWTAPDGKTIEGLLTRPVGHTPGERAPLVVMVHGGPTGVFVRSYTGAPTVYSVAGFATRGFAVLRANVRGSSGYGRLFRHANYKDWGGGDYRDILSGVDALVARGIADPERLGIMGWSYGGYMTSWVITQTDRFKAASVGAGVTNLMSFTGTADIPSFLPDYLGGEHWDVFDAWRARSALFHVKGVTTPTLILHGEADRRVPVSQGYELYNALKRQGVTTRMVVYPRQPHSIQEPKLTLDAMQRNLAWFERHVLGRDPAAR